MAELIAAHQLKAGDVFRTAVGAAWNPDLRAVRTNRPYHVGGQQYALIEYSKLDSGGTGRSDLYADHTVERLQKCGSDEVHILLADIEPGDHRTFWRTEDGGFYA